MQKDQNTLVLSIEEAKNHQIELRAIYKEIIGVVNDLKTRSKSYMEYVSDIDDGLDIKYSKQAEENIAQLAINIEEFNSKVGTTLNRFNKEFNSLKLAYQKAFGFFKGNPGEFSLLIEVRKNLLYLSALLRKFRSKIAALQQVNNVLFSLSSSENKKSRESYRANLSSVHSTVLLAIEQISVLSRKIESLELT